MEPLPVRVAVSGLIGSAETIRFKITAFLQRNADPGAIAESVLRETTAIQGLLISLRRSIDIGRVATRENIYIDQLSTVLTGCVKRFSELEALLGGLPTIREAESRTIDESRWAQNEKRIRAVVETLQPYKVSLNLILELLALQSMRRQDLSLEHMQRDIEHLKEHMLVRDNDLAARIRRSTLTSNSDAASMSSDSMAVTSQPTSPSWSGRDPMSPQSERPSHSLRNAFRSRTHRSDPETTRLSTRTPSVKTTSSSMSGSTTSASTMTSSSTSSRMSLAALSDISVYRLPITPEDVSNGHRYIDLSLEPVLTSDDENTSGDGDLPETVSSPNPESIRVGPSEHHKILPIHSRPESRATSSLGLRSPQLKRSNSDTRPTAEIEMSARKYQGYWRASFTANVPAALAMCGCILLVASSSSGSKLTESEETIHRAESLCDALSSATSPAKVIQTLHSNDLKTMLFALKSSSSTGQIPMIPTKIAFELYKRLSEAKGDAKKRAKVWQHLSKSLKKVPQETMVPLMFLLTIGRKLTARGLMVDNRSAAVCILQSFWPQLGSGRALFDQDTETADTASKLLLENFDEIPDELPVIMQAINYRFESGSRCNLLTLLTTKRPRPGIGDTRQSTDTSGS